MYDHGSNFVADLEDMDAMIGVADDAQAPAEPSLSLLPLKSPLAAILAFSSGIPNTPCHIR